ncbi:SfnB family sulfur acquisition oxidoreductase [Beijerinckia indica]|uniref:Dibenzothiophene monooxygenase n=1 Tax=Beijerinckia indica subsp. indica (strain ATCC 9039 / DSM 1715 / NCIMB 8712) TaxID=395963 RepID=B2IFB1_BEII9|nr:SfnB family sulfur acquisition oxidoreductase [Beijerinckia indica]ACB95676.1 Acyl-CoA dehydrogenase type 2 domain [Beijerinckia indica subsp. indica ATCC 9039]
MTIRSAGPETVQDAFPARAKIPEPAHILRDDAEAIAIAHALAEDFAKGAAERDRERRLPFAELDRFSQSGLWGMTVPRAYGGAAVSYVTVAKVFAILAAADASIAQIAQNHVSLVDILRFDPVEARKSRYYQAALEGVRFGNALSEKSGKTIFDMKTRLIRKGDRFIVTGQKFYCTGALFAHIVPVLAIDEAGKGHMVMVPRDAPGLSVIDDWNGVGQRTTASGTVILADVDVTESQIVPSHLAFDQVSVHGAVAQIIQAAIDAGIARRAFEETVTFVRQSARPWVDSGQDRASDDVYSIQAIADLQIRLHAAEAVLERGGEVIDAGLLEETAETVAEASIAIAEAKVLTTEISLLAGEKLFELGGSRSVLSTYNFDRLWRDARTHTLHDPVRWKFHAIGNYYLNGIKPPRHSWL